MDKKILFLGCGKMGSIILQKLLQLDDFNRSNINVLKPSSKNQIDQIKYFYDLKNIAIDIKYDIVFLCIKPQNSQEILQQLAQAKIIKSDAIIISIMAGKKIAFLQKIFGKKTKIIRSMPNTLIQLDQGIVPYFVNQYITDQEEQFFQKIFSNFSECFKIDDENLFHGLTAIFASGPAMIYEIALILNQITIDQNIEPKLAKKLITKLFSSSALALQKNDDIEQLISQITSAKGTTMAMLDQLNKKNRLKNIISQAIIKSKKTSIKLSK
jgi:pyrroline-5-carboxylate reductase